MNLGIIGLGRVAWLLEQDPLRAKPATHLGAWQRVRGAKLVAACDNDPERRAAFQAAYPRVRIYENHRELFANEALDLVSICAYADSRKDMVLAACKAGVQGIWCEKAMSTTLKEALQIERAVKRYGVQLAVHYQRRWSPPYQWVANAIRTEKFGRVESVNVQFPSNFMHTGTHAFDVLRMWCGEAESVQGWLDAGSEKVRDSGYQFDAPQLEHEPQNDLGGFGVIRFKNGIRATIQGSAKKYFRFEFEVLTEKGMIRLGNTQRELWEVQDSPRYQGFRELTQVEFPKIKPKHVAPVPRNLIRAVQGKEDVLCDATDGRKAVEMGIALHQSHAQGHKEIRIRDVQKNLVVRNR